MQFSHGIVTHLQMIESPGLNEHRALEQTSECLQEAG